jgi:hypothetical protein
MRYMVFMIPGSRARMEAGAMPDAKLIDAMMKFNEQLASAGVLVALDGFHPTSHAARVRFGSGSSMVTPGPFPMAPEIIGGYWIWKVGSREEALDWARRVPAEPGDVLELREIMEMDVFPDDVVARGQKLTAQMTGAAAPAKKPAAHKPAASKPAAKKKPAARKAAGKSKRRR